MRDYLSLAYRGLKRQPLRSFLTVFAIVVAMGAIFVLVSLTQGLKDTVVTELSKLGTNRIIVVPGTVLGVNVGGDYLTEEDLRAVEGVPGVRYVLGLQRSALTLEWGGEEKPVVVSGVDPEAFEKSYQSLLGAYIEEGRSLEAIDRSRHVALLGYSVAHGLFEKNIHVGNTVRIGGVPFRVVGIMKRTYSPLDSFVLIPERAYKELVPGESKYVRILALTAEGTDVEEVKERIERRLKSLHGGVEDFTVLTSQQAFQRAVNIINLVSAFLIVIAVISLVIGSLGIMNTVYMNVVERTREIGIMKAVGATGRQIGGLFVLEAGILGVLGGVFGTILGTAAVLIAQFIIRGFLDTYTAYLSPLLYGAVVLVSFLVGVVAGYLPARSAVRLDPVEALRR